MTTEARIGWGAVFQTRYISDWNVPLWETTGELINFGWSGQSRDTIDASNECLPEEWRTSIPGLKSGGELMADINFTEEGFYNFQKEFDLAADDAVLRRRFLFPDGTVYYVDAYLTSLDMPVAVGDKVSASAKFKISGQPGKVFTVPLVGGEPPVIYADFVNFIYMYNNDYYNSAEEWLVAIGDGAFSRPSPATALGPDGYYNYFSDDQLRFEYDSNGDPIGLLLEEARTNFVETSLSCSLSGSNETPTTEVTSPYPLATVVKCVRDGTGDNNVGFIGAGQLSEASTASTQYYFSAYVWVPTNTGITQVQFSQESGSPAWPSTNWVLADLSKRDQWQKVSGTITTTAAAGSPPSVGNPNIVLRLTGPTGAFVYTCMWQLEAGDFASSYIPRDFNFPTETKTRDFDALHTNFVELLAGTAYFTGDSKCGASDNSRMIGTDNNTARTYLYTVSSASRALAIWNGSSGVASVNVMTADVAMKGASSWNGAGRSICLNGSGVVSDANTQPYTPENGVIMIGGNFNGGYSDSLNGHCKEFAMWTVKATSAQLQALTD